MTNKILNVVFLCLDVVAVITAQGLISSFQDFATLNTPSVDGTHDQTSLAADTAFPSTSNFPTDSPFPTDPFPTDIVLSQNPSGGNMADLGNTGVIGIDSGLPMPSSDIANQLGIDARSLGMGGSMSGTVIDNPMVTSNFLPDLPQGGQFVDLISGITTSLSSDKNLHGIDQSSNVLGTSVLDKQPVEASTIFDSGSNMIGNDLSGQILVDQGLNGPSFPQDFTQLTGSGAGIDTVGAGLNGVGGMTEGITLSKIPGSNEDVSLGPGLTAVGSNGFDGTPQGPGLTAGMSQGPGILPGVPRGPEIVLDRSTMQEPGGLILGDPANLVPLDVAAQNPDLLSGKHLMVGPTVDTAQGGNVVVDPDTGKLQMSDAYNLMARANIGNFNRNRDLTRKLRNMRRKARKEWKQNLGNKAVRQARKKFNKQNKDAVKVGTVKIKTGPKGAMIAQMVRPGQNKPVVGKNRRGRRMAPPCTKNRRQLGLCSKDQLPVPVPQRMVNGVNIRRVPPRRPLFAGPRRLFPGPHNIANRGQGKPGMGVPGPMGISLGPHMGPPLGLRLKLPVALPSGGLGQILLPPVPSNLPQEGGKVNANAKGNNKQKKQNKLNANKQNKQNKLNANKQNKQNKLNANKQKKLNKKKANKQKKLNKQKANKQKQNVKKGPKVRQIKEMVPVDLSTLDSKKPKKLVTNTKQKTAVKEPSPKVDTSNMEHVAGLGFIDWSSLEPVPEPETTSP